MQSLIVTQSVAKHLISVSENSTTTDTSRQPLTLVQLKTQDGKILKVSASDGHVATYLEIDDDIFSSQLDKDQDYTLSQDDAQVLKTLLKINKYTPFDTTLIKKHSGEFKLHNLYSFQVTQKETHFKVGLNPDLLSDIKKAFVLKKSRGVSLYFDTENPMAPILVKGDHGQTAALMPCRV